MHQPVFDSYVKQLVPGLSGRVFNVNRSQSIIEARGGPDLHTHAPDPETANRMAGLSAVRRQLDRCQKQQVVEF